MGDPPGEKNGGICFRHVGWIIIKIIGMKIIPYMIQRHDDDDDSTEQVNGFNSLAFNVVGDVSSLHVFAL